ncbi:phosphohistidine phosphatase SixA [Shewanella sp. NFH-SH190041]|uniref:phosphohistidine phosphatase SixA n=1 Tax=Shewanella sp. NFH-SH190041 TaxID=2950245 RepID=UPI0021C3FFA2|nr:phosphohistidine phosphatase SixA [Shewanella sp. NFH-SH190041]BDM63867.1 phosphohistidine phosphatase SixA [Shewanella sp. NFH-SH190041]
MQLFLMRHGEASYEAASDRERVLTAVGRQQTSQMSHWLAERVSGFDLVLVSPYLRVQQTWQQLSCEFAEPGKWLVLDELVPSADAEVAAQLILAYAAQCQAQRVLVISHMPLLGYLVSELTPGIEPPLFATSAIAQLCVTDDKISLESLQSPHTLLTHA